MQNSYIAISDEIWIRDQISSKISKKDFSIIITLYDASCIYMHLKMLVAPDKI